MNQAASATGRSPAGSTATAGCCPMFGNPFFMNTFAPQAPLLPLSSAQPCFMGAQAHQIQSIASVQQQTTAHQQQPSVGPQSAISAQSDRSQQVQRPRPQDHSNQGTNTNNINNYSTSFTAPTLSLQHLLANRHPATNCMALAAALASASFPHFQQLQQQNQQNYQQSSITTTTPNLPNQTTTNNISVTNNSSVNLAPQSTATAAPVTSQVPTLNFNSYNDAPQNLNSPAQNAQQPPPVTAHLNLSNQQQQQSNTLVSHPSGDTGGQNRSSLTNTLLNNMENQQQQITTVYRRAPVAQVGRPQQQQNATAPPLSAQHIAQVTRATLSDEAFNSLLNEQFQATMLLNQLLANNQFTTSLGPISVPQQHATQPQQLASAQPNLNRSQFNVPNHVQLPIPSAQVPASFVPQQRLEQVSSQQQPQQATSQPTTRMAQVPNSPDTLQTSGGGIYQQQQQSQHTNAAAVNQQQSQTFGEQNAQAQQIQLPPPSALQQAPTQHQPPAQQQQQPPTIPSVPFYPIPQVEQALALLANPQVANNIFSQIFSNIYLQSGLRSEQHSHHNQTHHFHPHLHGHHPHHHHGPNGAGNGQDVTLPVDSLAISESKPKGLNRAEIDSLTHYIHTDEKDSRTCVICLSKFELKSKIRPLSCKHAFHAKCVDKWLRANRTCPICRRDALKTHEGKIKRI